MKKDVRNTSTEIELRSYDSSSSTEQDDCLESKRNTHDQKEEEKNKVVPVRYLMAVLGFWGIFNVYAMRVNLSVALVAMVIQDKVVSEEYGTACLELLPQSYNSTLDFSPKVIGEFDWNPKLQGIILGSFFYGYVITQIPGGRLAEKFGAKWLFGFGVLITAIFTLLTPIAARYNVWALVACRVIEGLGEGVTFPAMNAFIGRWVPKMERSRLATFIFSGSPVGTVVSMVVSGVLCSSDILGGWPAVFYVFGALGCVWFVFWMALVYDSPEDHPKISKRELMLIKEGQDPISRDSSIPWKQILTSGKVWALVTAHFGYNWGFYTLLTELPTYLSNILHFDLKANGTLSAVPYLAQALFAFLASFIADKLRATNNFRITTIRKIMNSVAFYGPGLIVLGVAFVGCDPVVIVILLAVSVGLNGFMYSGFNVTHVDMSPEFAGTLMGITNCIANMAGFLAPAYVGWAVHDGQTLENWATVFITTSAMFFVTGSVYNIMGSAEPQPWGTTTRTPS